MNIKERQQKIKNFLQDNNTQRADIEAGVQWGKVFYKLNFGRFDYVYVLEYSGTKPREKTQADFGGVIDRTTNRLYFAGYDLRQLFNPIEGAALPLDNTTAEDINKLFNDGVINELDRMTKETPDNLPDTEEAISKAKESAQRLYYYNEPIYKRTPGTAKTEQREITELLNYIENPAQAIQNSINDYVIRNRWNEENITDILKKNLQAERLTKQALHNIETLPEFEYLRISKAIKNSMPEGAKTVNIFYLLSNGETVEGKLNAEAFLYLPYWTGDKAHTSAYNTDKATRETIQAIDGREHADVFIKNILKLTYKGKTIYTKPENTNKAEA